MERCKSQEILNVNALTLNKLNHRVNYQKINLYLVHFFFFNEWFILKPVSMNTAALGIEHLE